MVIIDDLKVAFIAVPRTASTAIIRALTKAFPNARSIGQHRVRLPPDVDATSHYVFGCARNPYQRMVSHYLHRHRMHPLTVGRWNFSEYVAHATSETLSRFGLANDPPALKWLQPSGCRHVLRFESLDEDWAQIPAWITAGFVPKLRQVNQSIGQRSDWRLHYTEELAEATYRYHRPDFEAFGYDVDSWRADGAPQQRRFA